MSLRLGINTCFAVKRWPAPDEWAQVVADELGLDLVQHSLDLVDLAADDLDEQAALVAAACGAHGLHLHSTFTGLAAYSSSLLLDPDANRRRAAVRFLERAIAFSARAGARATGGHVGSLSAREHADPPRRAERWEALRAALAHLATFAHEAGLEALLVENMACGREPSTMAQVSDLLTPGDTGRVPVRLCLDIGHQCVPGTTGAERDPYAWLQRMGADSSVIHLQQSDADADHHWPFTAAYNAAGRIDARRVLEALGEAQPVLVLEVIPPFELADDQVLADLRESVAYWKAAL
ncbi:MAG TPA: TIM barrel protein [Solirubrobacteraceae bacterium]|nr:TIM barrel protein [Solirubrobacteraceae bacterium]